MTRGPCVAAVLVTCNAEPYLEDTVASLVQQTRTADLLLAVDDHSRDGTRTSLLASGFHVEMATTTASDPRTRIAQNFHQALRVAAERGAEIVVLGDHDDIWHPDRVAHQVDALQQQPWTALVASDGFLIDEHGAAIPGTIRRHFPIPDDFNVRSRAQQLAYATRHSVATGGACALRLAALADWSVPPGWLHDRWWSLVALRAGAFYADITPVIDYRISGGQEVGLDTAHQESRGRWVLAKARSAGTTAARARDLARLRKTRINPPR